jgi:hypothetical protein
MPVALIHRRMARTMMNRLIQRAIREYGNGRTSGE